MMTSRERQIVAGFVLLLFLMGIVAGVLWYANAMFRADYRAIAASHARTIQSAILNQTEPEEWPVSKEELIEMIDTQRIKEDLMDDHIRVLFVENGCWVLVAREPIRETGQSFENPIYIRFFNHE